MTPNAAPAPTRFGLLSNIVTTLSTRVVLITLGLVSSVITVRALGPEGRGLFALVFLLPEFAGTFALLGYEQANTVYAGLKADRRDALVWHSVAIALVVGGAVAAGGAAYIWFGAPGFASLVRGPFWLYLLPLCLVPVRLLVEYWASILRGMDRILLVNVLELGRQGALVILVLVVAVGPGLAVARLVWIETAVTVGAVILLAGLLWRAGILRRPTFDWSLWRVTTRFALPAHGGSIASYLNYRVDALIIAAWLPPEQLAFYVLAVSLAERLWIPTGAVATALLPHLTNSSRRDPALAAVIARHVMLWTAAACLLVFAFAGIAVETLYTSAFAPAVAPLRWLLPGIATLTIGKVVVAEMFAREKVRYTMWTSGLAALVNVAANWVLIPRMGISGAALASSISYSLLSVVGIWYYLRETGLPWTVLVPQRTDLARYAAMWSRGRAAIEAPEPA